MKKEYITPSFELFKITLLNDVLADSRGEDTGSGGSGSSGEFGPNDPMGPELDF